MKENTHCNVQVVHSCRPWWLHRTIVPRDSSLWWTVDGNIEDIWNSRKDKALANHLVFRDIVHQDVLWIARCKCRQRKWQLALLLGGNIMFLCYSINTTSCFNLQSIFAIFCDFFTTQYLFQILNIKFNLYHHLCLQ